MPDEIIIRIRINSVKEQTNWVDMSFNGNKPCYEAVGCKIQSIPKVIKYLLKSKAFINILDTKNNNLTDLKE